MAFTIDKDLIFVDSMQFMNSSLEKLSKHFSDNDLAREFGSQNLMLLKWWDDYPYEYMNIFERYKK